MMSDFQISLIVDFVICGGGSKIKFSLKGLTALEAERRIFYLPFRFPEVVSLKSDVKSERVFLGDIYLLPIGAHCKDFVFERGYSSAAISHILS